MATDTIARKPKQKSGCDWTKLVSPDGVPLNAAVMEVQGYDWEHSSGTSRTIIDENTIVETGVRELAVDGDRYGENLPRLKATYRTVTTYGRPRLCKQD
jgi:hypothetical protein